MRHRQKNRGPVAGRYAVEPEDPRTLISSTKRNTLQVQEIYHMQCKSKSIKASFQLKPKSNIFLSSNKQMSKKHLKHKISNLTFILQLPLTRIVFYQMGHYKNGYLNFVLDPSRLKLKNTSIKGEGP